MPTLANADYLRPKDASEFEDIVCDAANLSTEWGATDFKRYGRSGQKQDGLDAYSQTLEVGLQCKNVKKLTQKIVTTEIDNAEKFSAKLTHFCVATTAPRDQKVQTFVFNLSAEREKLGKFSIGLWFWDDIIQDLAKDPKQIQKYYGQFFIDSSRDDLIDVSKKLGVVEYERDFWIQCYQAEREEWMQRYQDLERQLAARDDDISQRAQAFLKQGDLDRAEELFDQAKNNDFENAATSLKKGAANAFASAQIKALKYKTLAAIREATLAANNDLDNVFYWEFLGNLQLRAGNLPQAKHAFQQMMRITSTASLAQPNDLDLLRNLSVSHNKIGNIQHAQGDLAGALVSYRAGLAIAERLAQHDEANTLWQRDLSVANIKIGDIHRVQGDLVGALEFYRAGLTIRECLAQQDATNTQWQSDRSVAQGMIGATQEEQGDLSGALVSYRKTLAIQERLAQHDAANTLWQRDLGVSHDNIGDIQKAQGDLAGALLSFHTSLTIRERLALHDAENVQWQTDIVISCVKLSSLRGQGVSDQDAAGYLQRALGIAERLQREGKLNAQQQVWVEDLREKLAKIGAK